ncbi:PREDICTED: histone H3.3-like [Dufourea novaeangliae]|uniref:histone H3.3-like n=1 Tax=Dufourea novaeangliae TaxID=178035 RepID=UPI0007679654|nr:PREDICTED: histone H3.3-like [Dufourea novaeangliae]
MVRRKGEARSSRSRTSRETPSKSKIIYRRRHVLQDIKYLRKTVQLLIPKSVFMRVIRQIISDLFPNSGVVRIQASALEALQEATEAYIVQFFEDCTLLSMHAKRITLQVHDMRLLRRLRGRSDIVNK